MDANNILHLIMVESNEMNIHTMDLLFIESMLAEYRLHGYQIIWVLKF